MGSIVSLPEDEGLERHHWWNLETQSEPNLLTNRVFWVPAVRFREYIAKFYIEPEKDGFQQKSPFPGFYLKLQNIRLNGWNPNLLEASLSRTFFPGTQHYRGTKGVSVELFLDVSCHQFLRQNRGKKKPNQWCPWFKSCLYSIKSNLGRIFLTKEKKVINFCIRKDIG